MDHFTLFPTPIGDCGIAWRGDRVIATQLPEMTAAATAARMASRADAAEGVPPAEIRDVIASITSLLSGAKVDLTGIRCDFTGIEPFAADVYARTRAIPAGETLTYGDIAIQLGDRQLAQRVGRALGRNPLPIIVPCHRVVGASGKLTGFSAYGGVETKLKMLAIEGAVIGNQPGLFDDLSM